MCGIAGLYLKTPRYEDQLGALMARMLAQMADRGPDSAGFAIYSNPTSVDNTKLTLLDTSGNSADWDQICGQASDQLGGDADACVVQDHAVVTTNIDGQQFRNWILDNYKGISVLSEGQSIELFKAVGHPSIVAERYGLANLTGTHAIVHTRMATESAVTTAGSHPFSTGADTCLVHNGSLSNHNRLREVLRSKGEVFQTENDTEVAAGFLAWRIREGDNLNEALEHCIEELDGFYTFCIGTRDGFAVLRDPIACKPAVMAETDDWVAMASEYRAIAELPDAKHASVSEPQPAKIYTWGPRDA